MKRRPRPSYDRPRPPRSTPPPPSSPSSLMSKFNYATIALLGGIFVLGIGVGIAFSSTTSSFNGESINSPLEIDQQAPNAQLCQQFGASAIVTDMRVFVTLKPFNVFISQPVMQPGCVLRRNNWSILEQQNLLTSEQMRDCKRRMNTFGFTGPLEGSPRISCIYQNDAAGNLFMNRPGGNTPGIESDF